MPDAPALKSILVLAANPKGTENLRLDEEKREIIDRLRSAGYGKVPISSTGATRPRDIQQAMVDFKPQIVHFTGHGAGQDGLAFEDGTGRLKLVSSEALADLFKLFSERVECVVLNACYSEFQAKAIVRHINYVIGMSKAIGDRAAIEFSVGFYTAIGAGESIEFAYQLGCNAIQLEGIPENLTPVLFRKVGSNRVHLPNGEQPYYQSGDTKFSPEVTRSSASIGRSRTVDEARSESKRRRKRYPLWVKISLWTVHSRSLAWSYFWLNILGIVMPFSVAILFADGFWQKFSLFLGLYDFFVAVQNGYLRLGLYNFVVAWQKSSLYVGFYSFLQPCGSGLQFGGSIAMITGEAIATLSNFTKLLKCLLADDELILYCLLSIVL